MTYTATYSPDDNKLRLYASSRLDAETYARAKSHGFHWAPKQELFFATWNPGAEDFLIELADEIEDEDKSLTERAEERAERFEDYSDKRGKDADRARAAVSAIADNIPMGQPILVGHHSERHARRDAERIEDGMHKAIKMWETSKYWASRAAGAIASAKYKERPDVRHRRIKTIEADKRKQERTKADAEKWLKLWTKDGLTYEQAVALANYSHLNACRKDDGKAWDWWHAWDVLRPDGERYNGCPSMTPAQLADRAREGYPLTIAHCDRWINHYNLRLEYERAMLQEAGGLPAESMDIQVGGRIKFRGEWGTVLKVIKRDGVALSIKTNARGWGTVGIEEIREYEAPDQETAAKVAQAMKLPPLCNYPGEGFKHMTRAELDACKERKWSDFPKIGLVRSTVEYGAHRVQQASGETQWKTVKVYITDEKRKDPPAPNLCPPQIEAPRRDPVHHESVEKQADERAERFQALKETAAAGVQVVTAPQLFPTPPDLAARMVDLADIRSAHRVLEPSAGTGRIVEAIEAQIPAPSETFCIEINRDLSLRLNSPRRANKCIDFLEYTCRSGYDRIVMNPPFANGADIKHILHANAMLRPGGRLVALCANGPKQRETLQPLAVHWEDLPADTFKAEGTGVNVALLVIEKDDEPTPEAPTPDPEKALRDIWNAKGVPEAKQDEVIASITAAAQPGAPFGPGVIGEPWPDPEAKRRAEIEAPHYALTIQAGAIPTGGPQQDLFGAAGLDRKPARKFLTHNDGGLFK